MVEDMTQPFVLYIAMFVGFRIEQTVCWGVWIGGGTVDHLPQGDKKVPNLPTTASATLRRRLPRGTADVKLRGGRDDGDTPPAPATTLLKETSPLYSDKSSSAEEFRLGSRLMLS